MIKLISTTLVLLLLIACGNIKEQESSDFIIIGSFNIAWLGDGVNDRIDRVESDYKKIAGIIKSCRADIIGIQEVENPEAIMRILIYLPGYNFQLAESGRQQRPGILYKNQIEILNTYENNDVAVIESRTRPGFVFEAKSGNFDFIGMVVHFKSTSRWDDTPQKKAESRIIRRNQAKVVENWVDTRLQNGSEKDIVILGDFNDYPGRKENSTINQLMQEEKLVFITDNLMSCKYPSLESIDHILITRTAEKRYIKNSAYMFDITSAFSAGELKTISDHCPVIAKFEITSPDND